MLNFNSYQELKNGKKYNNNLGRTMSQSGGVEDHRASNSSEYIEEEVPEIRTLNQEAVNEQIKGFIALLTRQLEELTGLVQGMVKTPHPSHYPRTDYSTFSGTAAHHLDNWKSEFCMSHLRNFKIIRKINRK